jgi:hypothetical protein
MIVFDLSCAPAGHLFECWFASSDAYADQRDRGLLICPHCGSSEVAKAPMAPAVPKKGNQLTIRPATPAEGTAVAGGKLPPEAAEMIQKLAALQAGALKQSRWVGGDFAEQSRAIHYGERPPETIHGQATVDEARDLLEEGITVLPLLIPVIPPEQAN